MKRRLITMRVAQDDLALSPGKATEVELGSPLDSFGQEWLIASHTVTLLDDGTALLTFVLERRGWYRRRDPRAWPAISRPFSATTFSAGYSNGIPASATASLG